LIDELRTKYLFTKAKAAQPQSWYSFSSGYRGFNYGASFATGRKLRAEIYIDVGDKIGNEQAFDLLLSEKQEIEREFGGSLEWQKLEARRACRISAVRQDTAVDQLPGREEELRKWLIEKLLALKRVIGPRLKNASDLGERRQDPAGAELVSDMDEDV